MLNTALTNMIGESYLKGLYLDDQAEPGRILTSWWDLTENSGSSFTRWPRPKASAALTSIVLEIQR